MEDVSPCEEPRIFGAPRQHKILNHEFNIHDTAPILLQDEALRDGREGASLGFPDAFAHGQNRFPKRPFWPRHRQDCLSKARKRACKGAGPRIGRARTKA